MEITVALIWIIAVLVGVGICTINLYRKVNELLDTVDRMKTQKILDDIVIQAIGVRIDGLGDSKQTKYLWLEDTNGKFTKLSVSEVLHAVVNELDLELAEEEEKPYPVPMKVVLKKKKPKMPARKKK